LRRRRGGIGSFGQQGVVAENIPPASGCAHAVADVEFDLLGVHGLDVRVKGIEQVKGGFPVGRFQPEA